MSNYKIKLGLSNGGEIETNSFTIPDPPTVSMVVDRENDAPRVSGNASMSSTSVTFENTGGFIKGLYVGSKYIFLGKVTGFIDITPGTLLLAGTLNIQFGGGASIGVKVPLIAHLIINNMSSSGTTTYVIPLNGYVNGSNAYQIELSTNYSTYIKDSTAQQWFEISFFGMK